MKTQLKKEFKDKLLELGVYKQWRKNLIERRKYLGDDDIDGHIESLNQEKAFCDMILASFLWELTPEGHDFWHNISLK